MATIAIPIPALDFDPTEVAVSWKVLTDLGHIVTFATPDGRPGEADRIMVDGVGLDPWGQIPGLRRLRLIGLLLRARAAGRRAYADLQRNRAFLSPHRWSDLRASDHDALVLAGGHRARGMRSFLESTILQRLVAEFFAVDKPVGAICHGVLLAARSRRADGRSVLYGRRTTTLTWRQERTADRIARLGRWWDPGYYRTYEEAPGQPTGFMSVQAEVTRALARPADFVDVASDAAHRFRRTSGFYRDGPADDRAAFVVVDGRYVSARWPGDGHGFAAALDRVIRSAATS